MIEKYTRKLNTGEGSDYVANAKERVQRQKAETREHILQNPMIWGPGESIRDHEKDCFLNSTGSITFNEGDCKTDFFKNDSRRNNLGTQFGSRGANYFIALNPLRNTVAEKLDIIKEDIADIKNEIISVEVSWKEKLAMLDYAKQHALTIYHALQYPKRFGISLSKRHDEAIRLTEKMAEDSTRAFYLHMLGRPVDISYLDSLLGILNSIASFGVETNHFKILELDNPLVILGNSYANSIHYPETDTIIALPSGGTQPGIVTKVFMELIGKNPSLHFIPLSTHSTKKQSGEELSVEQLTDLISGIDINGKKVLVTEDNSNTGKTLTKMSDAIKRFEPLSVNSSLAELDPWRVFVKSKFGSIDVTDEEHPDFKTAVGVVPITRKFLPDRQVRKIAAQKVVFNGLEVNENQEETPVGDEEYQMVINSSEYNIFKASYENVLKKVGDKYGYRNPFMVAQEMILALNKSFYEKFKNTKEERKIISSVATALVKYPYLPQSIKDKLMSQQSTGVYEHGKDSPWLVEGSEALLEDCFASVARNDGTFYIWTKGDSHRKGYESLPGAHEQNFRYRISGLSELVERIKAKHNIKTNQFKFLSLPQKTRLIKELVDINAKNIGSTVFVVEDTIENIVDAKKIVTSDGIEFESFLIDRGDKGNSLVDCGKKVRDELSGKRVAFVFDMDDTLLHEDFRKEHQPIQIYFRMRELGII